MLPEVPFFFFQKTVRLLLFVWIKHLSFESQWGALSGLCSHFLTRFLQMEWLRDLILQKLLTLWMLTKHLSETSEKSLLPVHWEMTTWRVSSLSPNEISFAGGPSGQRMKLFFPGKVLFGKDPFYCFQNVHSLYSLQKPLRKSGFFGTASMPTVRQTRRPLCWDWWGSSVLKDLLQNVERHAIYSRTYHTTWQGNCFQCFLLIQFPKQPGNFCTCHWSLICPSDGVGDFPLGPW